MEIEDKAWCVNTIGETSKIWVIHQAASRQLRKDIATQMRKSIKELDIVDSEELHEKIEAEAVEIENNFLRVVNEKRVVASAATVHTSVAISVGASYNGSLGETAPQPLQKVPIFDFEIN
jgi:hypothetical protein